MQQRPAPGIESFLRCSKDFLHRFIHEKLLDSRAFLQMHCQPNYVKTPKT
jgi:hypothetical protein